MNTVPSKPPVAAGWITLALAWLMFLIPIPGLGILGWAVNLAALIVGIVVLSKGATGNGIAQIVASIVVSPIVYFIGLALFVGTIAALEHA